MTGIIGSIFGLLRMGLGDQILFRHQLTPVTDAQAQGIFNEA